MNPTHLTDRGGHLDANGYRWFGEMLGKVYYQTQIKGKNFKPLQPKEILLDRATGQIQIRFHVPVPPLALDVNTLPKIRDYGFEVYQDKARSGNRINITKVELNGKDKVVLTCDKPLEGDVLIMYAGSGSCIENQPQGLNHLQGHGNLRDSDSSKGFYKYIDLDGKNADGAYIYPREKFESGHKRFRMAKAQELQALARNSFGFAMAGDVFSTMIRLYAKHLDFLKQQVREMDRKIAEIMETLDTPITTITGIGPTLGAYILSEIGDISRFSSAAKLAAYAGIDPTMRQSGEYNGVRNRMSKRGSPYLRHAIWLAASSAVLHDPALKLYFQKKRDEGKPYMASVGHACRKMVSIIYAVMRDNKAYTPYIPNEISA